MELRQGRKTSKNAGAELATSFNELPEKLTFVMHHYEPK